LGNRVSDSAPISLGGGVLTFAGRAQMASSETLGAVTLKESVNNITVNTGGTNVNSAVLTLADLQRDSTNLGSAATVTFNNATNLGLIGSNPRVLINSYENGTRTLTNNILGGWAVTNGAAFEFASYVPGMGVGPLNQVGFAGYDATTLPTVSQPTYNVRLASGATMSGSLTFNAVNSIGAFNFTNATDMLNLASGGFIAGGSVGSVGPSGSLTAGGGATSGVSDLYLTRTAGGWGYVYSNVVDNPSGARLRLVLNIANNGGGIQLLGTGNSYTGGTVLDGWALNLGTTGYIPAANDPTQGLIITGNSTGGGQGVVFGASNQIASANQVTFSGNAILAMGAFNQQLAGLNFSANGSTSGNPSVTGTGTLTLTGTINATSNNPGVTPTIAVSNLYLNGGSSDNGVTTIKVAPILLNGVNIAPWSPTLNITSAIKSGTLSVIGGGLLQLSSANTFTGGVTVAGDSGLSLGNATALGTGTLTLGDGATLLASSVLTIANSVNALGNLKFAGSNALTLSGSLNLAGGALVIAIPSSSMTVSLLGTVTATNTLTSITKTGLGTLTLNIGLLPGTPSVDLGSGGALSLLADGDTTGTPNTVTIANNFTMQTASFVVGRSGLGVTGNQAVNKTILLSNLTAPLGSGITVTPNNGYGLLLNNDFALTGGLITVSTYTASNVVQGLMLGGTISGAGGLIKAGAGVVTLTNSANSFTGDVSINAGGLSVGSNAVLGNASNVVNLGTSAAAQFRATSSFSSNRTFNFQNATNTNNVIEVVAGATLTLGGVFGTLNGFQKADNGTLLLTASNSLFTGAVTVAAGALQISNSGALGTVDGATTVSATGAALQLAGVTTAEPLSLTGSGINSLGALQAVSGANTLLGTVTLAAAAEVQADAGSLT
ncbi:MAG: hypothetical protein EBR81_11860, partial [Proteobacteria bacterium]|nr:hypothetical protein [Pseudomonadota bacterium]